MLERLLGIILPVVSIIVVGYVFARRVRPDMTMVNRISMNVLAPALVFSALASKDFDVAANRTLLVGAVGVVLGSGLLAWPFARLMRVSPRTFVPPMMFNNCGNMGLPLAVLAYGTAGFSPMVALFTISNLLQFTVGVWIIDHHARFGSLLILFGSLPPAVLNFIVAEQYNQEPAKVASIVMIGNLLAIVFVPLGLTIALRP
jgi:malate permease and related proteins